MIDASVDGMAKGAGWSGIDGGGGGKDSGVGKTLRGASRSGSTDLR